ANGACLSWGEGGRGEGSRVRVVEWAGKEEVGCNRVGGNFG
nr:hypothetical protein [Tanacetum cinerariifolium]